MLESIIVLTAALYLLMASWIGQHLRIRRLRADIDFLRKRCCEWETRYADLRDQQDFHEDATRETAEPYGEAVRF